MSHNINYCSYPLNCDRAKVQVDCDTVAIHEDWQEGCSGVNPIRWLDNAPICEDRESAVDYIARHDNGWYDCLAVKYKAPKGKPTSKKYEQLMEKRDAAFTKYHLLNNATHFANVKSATIGCKKCGSKIATPYMSHRNSCPVCDTDMRPQSTLDRISALKEAFVRIDKKSLEEYKKLVEKSYEIKWLVKYEYHT